MVRHPLQLASLAQAPPLAMMRGQAGLSISFDNYRSDIRNTLLGTLS